MSEGINEYLESRLRTPSPLVEPRMEQLLRGYYQAAEQIGFGGLSLDKLKALLDAQACAGEKAVSSIGPAAQAPTPVCRVPQQEETRYRVSRGWKDGHGEAVSVESLVHPISVAMANRHPFIWDENSKLSLAQAVKKYVAFHLFGTYCAEAFNLLKRPDEDGLEVDMFKTQFSARRLREARLDLSLAIRVRVFETPHIRLLYNILVMDYLGYILELFAPDAGAFDADSAQLCQEASRELQARLHDTADYLGKTDADQIHQFATIKDRLKTMVDGLRDGGTLNTSLRAILSDRMDDEFTLDIDGLAWLADQVLRAVEGAAEPGLSIQPAAKEMLFLQYLRALRERMRLFFKKLLPYL